ncbi:hypothetical protein D3C86_1942210 [compost metagenome]
MRCVLNVRNAARRAPHQRPRKRPTAVELIDRHFSDFAQIADRQLRVSIGGLLDPGGHRRHGSVVDVDDVLEIRDIATRFLNLLVRKRGSLHSWSLIRFLD